MKDQETLLYTFVGMILSEMFLPLTNLNWSREIKLDRIEPSLRLISLQIILLVKLIRFMGLYSYNYLGWSTLRSKQE